MLQRLTRKQIRAAMWAWARCEEESARIGKLGSPLGRIVDEGPTGAAIRTPAGPRIPLMPFPDTYWQVTRGLREVGATGRTVAMVEFGVVSLGDRGTVESRAKMLGMSLEEYRRTLRGIYAAVGPFLGQDFA